MRKSITRDRKTGGSLELLSATGGANVCEHRLAADVADNPIGGIAPLNVDEVSPKDVADSSQKVEKDGTVSIAPIRFTHVWHHASMHHGRRPLLLPAVREIHQGEVLTR